jgi:hypothetical protein
MSAYAIMKPLMLTAHRKKSKSQGLGRDMIRRAKTIKISRETLILMAHHKCCGSIVATVEHPEWGLFDSSKLMHTNSITAKK